MLGRGKEQERRWAQFETTPDDVLNSLKSDEERALVIFAGFLKGHAIEKWEADTLVEFARRIEHESIKGGEEL